MDDFSGYNDKIKYNKVRKKFVDSQIPLNKNKVLFSVVPAVSD